LIYNGINSRLRAVMRLIETSFDMSAAMNLRIYAPEAVTAFASRAARIISAFSRVIVHRRPGAAGAALSNPVRGPYGAVAAERHLRSGVKQRSA
jgi:hypothetical protein